MSTNTRVLFAGVLTTLAISAVGFDSLLAHSRIKQPSGYQARVSLQQSASVRVILPASAEPAHPPQPSTILLPETRPPAQAVKVQAPAEKQVEKAEALNAQAAEERRRRYAERKSKMIAARQQMEQMRQRPEPGILAFGGG